jgi:feruloyl esterase
VIVAALVTVCLALIAAEAAARRSTNHRPARRESSNGRVSTARADLGIVLPKKSCAELANADVSVTVGSATSITGTTMATAPEGYPLCKVTGIIAPQIQFELHLPTQTWRQRYLQNGCEGLCGNLNVYSLAAAGCVPLANGDFARAATNEGHVGGGNNDGNFGTDPALRVDLAYRSDHVVAVAAKALIRLFFGQGPAYSYFEGCSEGGRDGLKEAQRYPTDFNGIVAGAPASLIQYLGSIYEPWLANADFDAKGRQILGADKLPMLHRAVLAVCDGKDGVVDGQIDDPRGCTFDPNTLLCRGVDAPDCLTGAQVRVVKKLYSGPTDENGEHLYPGGEPYGSELAWTPWMIPPTPTASQSSTLSWGIGAGWLKYLAFETNPPLSFTLDRAHVDRTTFKEAAKLAGLYNATDPDLSAFQRAGGKLILWHGWADQAISPFGTVAYYQAMQDEMGGLPAVQRFARLFMVPGMNHCFGGDGPNTFDMLTPVLAWVEQGVAPSKIVATGSVNGTKRTRPVFPYPQVARYSGRGSIDDAASFVTTHPTKRFNDRFDWLGSFATHDELWAHWRDGKLVLDHARNGGA